MDDLIQAQWAALEVAATLQNVRLTKLSAEANVRACASILEGEKLRAESDLLASVGGEKGLGPNAEAQKRALAIHLRESAALTYAQEYLDGAREKAGALGVRESYFEEVYRVFLASIPDGAALSRERLDQILSLRASERAGIPPVIEAHEEPVSEAHEEPVIEAEEVKP